jgi:flagellar hook assembly protein FlgD
MDNGMTNGPKVTYPDGSTEQLKGQKVEIRLKRPILGSNGKQEVLGWLTIFDAVGNVLVKDKPLGMENATMLSMGWNGLNSSGMKVAGGTYLGRYVVKNIVNGETKREETGKVRIARKTMK